MNNPDSASNTNAEQERPDGAILHAQFDGILTYKFKKISSILKETNKKQSN